MQLPEKLQIYQEAAQELLNRNLIKEIEFSSSTYRLLFEEAPKEDSKNVWSFLRFNEALEIVDAFCECDCDDACVHLAASYLFIFQKPPFALHEHYNQSVWQRLGFLYFEEFGDQTYQLKKRGEGCFEKRSSSGKLFFMLEAKTEECAAFVNMLIEERKEETEKNSIKFSGLSAVELQAWKLHIPSHSLQFELSFWGDLSKWLFLCDWKKELSLQLEARSEALPHFLWITAPFFRAGFYISPNHLPSLLYPLARSSYSLPIHLPPSEPIESIVYLPDSAQVHLLGKKAEPLTLPQPLHPEKAIAIEDWLYVAGEGFFPTKMRELTAGVYLESEEIEHFFNQNLALAMRLMKEEVHPERFKLVETIEFDSNWNLLLSAHLFSLGDLMQPNARLFGEWAYLPGHGFYRLESHQFQKPSMLIPSENVSAFVTKNRSWLNTQAGFMTYLRNLESNLVYFIDEEHHLHFERRLLSDQNAVSRDFGSWIYVKGEGFYQKKEAQVHLPIQAGKTILAQRVSAFIDEYEEELSFVPKFYTSISAVKKTGLSLGLDAHGGISLATDYLLYSHFKKEQVIFYGHYVYLKGEGFHKIPFNPKIPSDIRGKSSIYPDQLENFYTQLYEQISPFLTKIDPRVKPAASLNLMVEKLEWVERGEAEISLVYTAEKGSCSLKFLCEAIKKKQRFVFTQVGAIDLSQIEFDFLHHLDLHRFLKNGALHLSMVELLKLAALQPLYSAHEEIKEQLYALTHFQTPLPPNIEGMQSTLRPYQFAGLQWLWFLYWNRLSGLLCDDMGLGKTHQAMGLMAAILNHVKDKPVHFVVICPTSVIYHWQDKLRIYFPNMRVCVYHGIEREIADFKQNYDLLLTSYGIWRNDYSILESVEFDLAIFDEIHMAKSHSSRLHASLHRVHAAMRLGLTGTPIENDLLELKALFDLVLPSYMPSEKAFREQFIKPIEKKMQTSAKELLSRYIRPFVLRRTKKEVLNDLPEKIEEIAHCSLSQQQKELYNDLLQSDKKLIESDLKQPSRIVPYMHIFAILSKLKQICNHPACYLKDVKNYRAYTSGKWDLFVELLSEAIEGGQKVVIFSQYLHMLDIIQCYLEENSIGYASIRGATVHRGAERERFEQDPDCKVFVASLQAAGVGIDLTAASVVIHYDRWWNAAKEEQATDRVHRIGQKRGVQVFKMVTYATFEERIHEMILQKAQLMKEVIGADENDVLKQLTREDLFSLLREVH